MKKALRHARKVSFAIGLLGAIVFAAFNWNLDLLFRGHKYTAKVLAVTAGRAGCYQIELAFARAGGEWVNQLITDCTGERFLLFFAAGDSLAVWESGRSPYRYYVPRQHLAVKVFIFLFFMVVPFIFAIFGR
jgi:hypothetical protein